MDPVTVTAVTWFGYGALALGTLAWGKYRRVRKLYESRAAMWHKREKELITEIGKLEREKTGAEGERDSARASWSATQYLLHNAETEISRLRTQVLQLERNATPILPALIPGAWSPEVLNNRDIVEVSELSVLFIREGMSVREQSEYLASLPQSGRTWVVWFERSPTLGDPRIYKSKRDGTWETLSTVSRTVLKIGELVTAGNRVLNRAADTPAATRTIPHPTQAGRRRRLEQG